MREFLRSYLAGSILLLAIAGCRDEAAPPDFGAPYDLVWNDAPGGPDVPPRIQGDYLLATLSYEGGCADHAFTLDYHIRQDTAFVWIQHESGGDTCEAYLTDEIHLALPLPVRSTPVIALTPPDGGRAYVLRWGL